MKQKQLIPMDLQFFAGEGEPAEITMETVKSFLESNEEGQKFLDSISQSAADKQLDNWQKKNLDKIKQEAINEYEASKKNKSPEQMQLERLQQDLETEKALRVTNENKAFVAEQISGLKIDDDLKESVSQFMLGNLVSENTEFTQKAVESFTGVLSTIQEKHADALKNVEMQSAFGGKQQTSGHSQQTNEPHGDPEELLGQILQQL